MMSPTGNTRLMGKRKIGTGLSQGSSLHKEMEGFGWSYVWYKHMGDADNKDNWEWEKWQRGWHSGPVANEGDKTWFSDLEKARKAIE